jgi:Uma2 family endonuclease
MSRTLVPKADSPSPPLEPGDRLTRVEFERRFDATPNLKKAELIEGVVYMSPAVRLDQHGKPHASLMTWVGTYWAYTPGVFTGDNTSIRLDLDNEPQPDAALMIEPKYGGRVTISEDDYVEGAPEFIAEVSSSSVSIDLNAKLKVYLRNGVREYFVWRVRDDAIDWFSLKNGLYQPLSSTEGIIRSETFPGLWLDPQLLIRGDLSGVLRVLRQGLNSSEHEQFISSLSKSLPR